MIAWLQKLAKTTLGRWVLDTGERVGSTFVVSFALFIASNATNVFSLDILRAAAISAGLAAGVILKGALASLIGQRDTASLLPASVATALVAANTGADTPQPGPVG